MKVQKIIGFSTLVFALTLGFSQCNGAKNVIMISETVTISKALKTQVYYQNWVAGVRGGGSGTDLYVSKSAVVNRELVTAYFRNKEVKFEPLNNNTSVYIARFKGDANQLQDKIMNADGMQEYGNKAPVKVDSIPFVLGVNDAVVSYLENNSMKYLKLVNIPEKPMLAYPSAPRK